MTGSFGRLRINKLLVLLLLTALIVSLFPCGRVYASDAKEGKTVRVGYYENEVFEEGASADAVKTGYAYEYYQKISEYTGWQYEYVYGGFNELYEMLLTGDIDLLAGLAKRDDRVDVIGYPDSPMGNETYTLVGHDDDSVDYSLTSIEGKRIGVLKSAIVDVLERFLADNSIKAGVVPFDDYESLFEAFDNKQVDILAAEGDGAYGRSHARVIGVFGTSDYYLCVNVQRPDLLEELNMAQSLLTVEEHDYVSMLQSKYYSFSVSSHNYSAAELEWVACNDSLRIGYLNDYLPYSDTDENGRVTGIIAEMMPDMLKELSVTQIEVFYTGYDKFDDMIKDINDGSIDLCFPVGGGLFYAEKNGIHQSAAVISAITDLVYEGDYADDDVKHFAVNVNNNMQYYYVHANFPEAEISFYPNIDACLMAVLHGEVGATTLNGLRANDILKNSRYKGLYPQQLSHSDDRCFGVKIGNEGLLKLINHGIKVLGNEYFQDIAHRYTGELYTYTFSDMVRDNVGLFLSLLLLIALFVIVLILRDARRTRLANSLKSEFVSNMSHEIRTPITAILGMNDLIQRECRDESILKYSDNIGKAGESLLAIINDVLDFSRIESGHVELVVMPYSLPELVSDIRMMIKMRAEEKNLSFGVEVDEKLPVMPIGDVQKLRQVIMNLLTNAVKYTQEGSVQLSMKLVSLQDDEFTMEVIVTDTGIGIKESEIDKLYTAFDRLDMVRNRNIEGSGLGLAITRSMLALMGSEINVKSVYGEGSSFFFEIRQGISDGSPVGRFEADGAAGPVTVRQKKSATFTAPDVRLLVVDDTPMNLQVITGLLKGNDLLIDTAESGMECIELFEKKKYDLVFLDQRMPNLDGVDTLSELKKKCPDKLRETPIICLTANALYGAKEQMIKAGFDDYLTKPVSLNDMEQVILKFISADRIKMTCEAPEKESLDDEDVHVPQAIAAIKELKWETGMEYCGGADDYLDALGIYADSVDDKADKLEKDLMDENAEEMSLLLHSLKSTSKAVGAIELTENAAALELSARNGDMDALRENLPKFVDKYRELGGTISSTLKQEESDAEKQGHQ